MRKFPFWALVPPEVPTISAVLHGFFFGLFVIVMLLMLRPHPNFGNAYPIFAHQNRGEPVQYAEEVLLPFSVASISYLRRPWLAQVPYVLSPSSVTAGHLGR